MQKTLIPFFALMFSQYSFAGVMDELTDAQKAAVQKGEQVFVTHNVQGSPCPKTFFYQRIDATPEEAMAVLSNYELQKTYIPNLKKSQVSKQINSLTAQIDYTLKVPVPFVPDENYTMETTMSRDAEGYRSDSKLVRADTTRDSTGYIRFETLGTGTIMGYYAFVVPGSGMADLVKSQALKQVKQAANAIVKRIEKVRSDDQAMLQAEIERLRQAFATAERSRN